MSSLFRSITNDSEKEAEFWRINRKLADLDPAMAQEFADLWWAMNSLRQNLVSVIMTDQEDQELVN